MAAIKQKSPAKKARTEPSKASASLVVRIPLEHRKAFEKPVRAAVAAKPVVAEAMEPIGAWVLRWDLAPADAKAAAAAVRKQKLAGVEVVLYATADLAPP